ncbi:MAG: hypothetical protein HWE08_08200 [Alphaproteobacteria bacterium]|nr:hypothetical protein [Alphaproteobacteria bacterium]
MLNIKLKALLAAASATLLASAAEAKPNKAPSFSFKKVEAEATDTVKPGACTFKPDYKATASGRPPFRRTKVCDQAPQPAH